MSTDAGPSGSTPRQRAIRAAQVIVVSSVMFTFISYWRTAAIVLCDLGSTAFYIGGIAEQFIGPAAPWFILAVLCFSFVVSLVYIESTSLFVRGGVYRVVSAAMGKLAGKVSVSALLFDYILTGPISSVSAGQYITGLMLETGHRLFGFHFDPSSEDSFRHWGAVIIAVAVTLYFFRLNLLGIHESSGKALRIIGATTIMAVIILSWATLTVALDGPRNDVPLAPDLGPKTHGNIAAESPVGFFEGTRLGDRLGSLDGREFLSLLGLVGIMIAFGHSILAMSGLETLAQVYREVEAPKLVNFKKAALIVFVYSLIFTGGISFLAVMVIPSEVRMERYAENLIGGLAMHVMGPVWLRLLLNALVVIVGFLILSGAVNTAIIGSNGVLNRVAEDGVVPQWLRKPHARYGTTHRILTLIVLLQLITIVASRGNVVVLGEAYAFGVVWSFTFMTASMLVLRFKDPTPRQFKVPLNIRIGRFELPLGLAMVFLILFGAAIANLLTKEMATKWGLGFTAAFLTIFLVTEKIGQFQRRGAKHEHLEEFNRKTAEQMSPQSLGLSRPYRKLVAIRSPNSMYMLEKALAETDPETTDVVVMTARQTFDSGEPVADLTDYDQQLMTGVVQRAELAGKQVKPLIVPTNNPLHAILRTAFELKAQEVVLGASNKYTAEEQLDQVALYWLSMQSGDTVPVTVRVLSRNRDLYFDLGGGTRIPKISERRARSVAELRAAGVGVDRVLLVHEGTAASSDLFRAVLTMLDETVVLGLVVAPAAQGRAGANGESEILGRDEEQARQLRREVEIIHPQGEHWGDAVVQAAREGQYDLIILTLSGERPVGSDSPWDEATDYILSHADCRVFVALPQLIPARTDEDPPTGP
jgi:amino acid transporter/nucleotide-binding universal stress UspA family protein